MELLRYLGGGILLVVLSVLTVGFAVGIWLGRRYRVVRHLGRVSLGAALIYLTVLFGAFAWQQPWRVESHWKNGPALRLATAATQRVAGTAPPWTVERLRARLDGADTLIAVSLSGGGSRAAYFAATMLERLSMVRMPGQQGPGSSLVNHIALLSTVSGGSVAGAYFTLNAPTGQAATDEALAEFFRRFKTAMATDFERGLGRHVINPLRTLGFITGRQPMAEALADVFDRHIFGDRNVTFAEARRRERTERAPLLVVNATAVDRWDLFAFTRDPGGRRVLVPTQRADPVLGRSTEDLSTWDYRESKQVLTFHADFGDLDGFRIADAVAASAAFPLLGAISLHQPTNLTQPTLRLADGGLFDNSGLVSLYVHLLQRPLFEAAAGKLKRIVVIAIDGTIRGGYDQPIGFISGIYDLGQQNIQQLAVPEMIRRATVQELADLLDDEAWREFRISRSQEYSYRLCHTGTEVPTQFRLTEAERASIQTAAERCAAMGDLRAALEGRVKTTPKYAGILGPADVRAWRRLLSLAAHQQRWMNQCGRFLTLQEIRAKRARCRAGAGEREVPVDAGLDGASHPSPFVFDMTQRGERLSLFATPSSYRQPGRVSLMVELTDEHLRMDDLRFCAALSAAVRGGDRRGARATAADPPFVPYGFHAYERCI